MICKISTQLSNVHILTSLLTNYLFLLKNPGFKHLHYSSRRYNSGGSIKVLPGSIDWVARAVSARLGYGDVNPGTSVAKIA